MTPKRIAFAAGLLTLAFSVNAATAAISATKTYIVQLADPPAATYAGGVAGLAATRPLAGAKLDASAAHVRSYVGFLDTQRLITLARIGNVPVMHKYVLTFNGFSARMTEAQAKALKTSGRVLSVTESELRRADTTRTPGFLGISAPGGLWSMLDAASRNVKGEDVIIGVIDTGVWPEDPSFGDKVDVNGKPVAYTQAGTSVYGPPPLKWKGACVAGPGFTAAMCNNKLIGARYFGTAWLAAAAASSGTGAYTLSPKEYVSPRDGDGHGTHTASTAGGNNGVEATVSGTAVGAISGIAPRARIATYKALWDSNTGPPNDGGQSADILAAIEAAVADSVDVINYSVSGSQTNFLDTIEIAYLNATAAGIFVAASAGNSGPANQVAHMSPWLMTVAASTHDRQALADLTLGNNAVYHGVSVYTGTLSGRPMVLAANIPAAGATVADAERCFANTLDATLAIGKIVVCDRGSSARVDKSAEVKRVGGAGMVLLNVSAAANGLVADFHTVPTVHLVVADRAAVRAYAVTAGATGSFAPPLVPPAVVAPVMADFSSRGPNKANPNILKPDITGPGVDIIAGWLDSSVSQAQHDALLIGNFTPQANANSISGTSMSSPHVAGAAALLRQLYPTWTPAAIKSALMTTTTGVKLANGTADPDRFGYGAGHMNPNGAANPGLVYDAVAADYGRFLCGLGLPSPAGIGSCTALVTSIQPWNLNLASLTAANVPGTQTLNRKVTNVGNATSTYTASTSLPGWGVLVVPASLTLAPGASANFNVTLTRGAAALNTWTFGNLRWSDGVHTVSSPLSARAVGFLAPVQVTDVRASGTGSKLVSVVSAYTGSLSVAATGLVPATRTSSTVTTGATQCFNFSVAAGAQLARFQLFNADTAGGAGTDLDLEVFNAADGTGTSVGASGGSSSDEEVTLRSPAGGIYSACVTGFAAPQGGAAYTLSSWVVGPALGIQTLRAAAPASVYTGGTASIGLGWTVPAGKRYLGNLQFFDNTSALIGSTIISVDNH